jgi:hypothetical protein
MEKRIIDDTPAPDETNEIEVAFATDHDYIASAVAALASVADIDAMILSKADEMRIKRIRRQSLRIISECINTLYDEIFDDGVDVVND